ncbi:MAG: hypothetical protein H8E25_14900, partial [Planctomycetes bacterium]|nr:hypothetical protein [Planctomycetota bacterium]
MFKRPTFVLAFMLSLLSTTPAQSGLEGLREVIVARNADKIATAHAAWAKHGPEFIKTGDRVLMTELKGLAPEIQEPLFEALAVRANDPAMSNETSRILQLLTDVLDQGSAARLLLILDTLPLGLRPEAAYSIIKCGAAPTQAQAKKLISQKNTRLSQSIVGALLLHGDPKFIPELSQIIDYENYDFDELGAILWSLAEIDFDTPFIVPEEAFLISSKEFRIGLITLLEKHPNVNAGDYLIRESIGESLKPKSPETAKLAVLAFEAGAREFNWSVLLNQYQRLLKSTPKHFLAKDIAYSLHRLGDKKGTKFLLSAPEKSYRDNNRNWWHATVLGSMQVELGLHADAYKVFKYSYDRAVKDESDYRKIKAQDLIWAARAPAGSGP